MRSIHGLACAALALMAATAAAGTIFVDDDAAPGGDGTSWATAFKHLQDALAVCQPGDEVRAGQGVYRPDRDAGHPNGSGDRGATFQIPDGVAVRGGYAGTGAGNPDERDPVKYVTRLSGDLAANDGPNWTNHGENSWHVVTIGSVGPQTTLDGAEITAGYADYPQNTAGGLLLSGGSPSLIDCHIKENLAQLGGGCVVLGGSPVFQRCTFSGNYAWSGRGGAIYHAAGSDVKLIDCRFLANKSNGGASVGDGGALFDEGGTVVTIIGCLFRDNVSSGSDPSYSNGGAVCHLGGGLTLINCTFQRNRALVAGAVWIGGVAAMSNCVFSGNTSLGGGGLVVFLGNVSLVNCVFHGNYADDGGGILNGYRSTVALVNCVLWDNTAKNYTTRRDAQIHNTDGSTWTAKYSCIMGLLEQAQGEDPPDPKKYPGCIIVDPLFVNPAGPDRTPGTADDDLRLQAGSKCIDAANNTAVLADAFDIDGDGNTSEPLPLDVLRQVRFVDDPAAPDVGLGTPPLVDMGACERQVGRPGDLNCDAVVNFADINPFVLALSDPEGYRRQFPDCNILNGDCNNDGAVNFGDINPFVELLAG